MGTNSTDARIRLTHRLWTQLHSDLSFRSDGWRETGAFLLGRHTGRTADILRVVHYDDIDPASRRYPYINIQGWAYGKLWHICRQHQMDVIADVHTHPGQAIQSSIDRNNPMIDRAGHLALILPYFATRPGERHSTGLYEYLGGMRWNALSSILHPTEALELLAP